jgi:hypothetical protein
VLGQHLTTLDFYTGTRAADGAITWSIASSLLRKVDYVRVSNETMLEMITSVDAGIAHYEPTLEDFSLVVGEILARKVAGVGSTAWTPILPSAAQTSSYYKVVFTRGGQTYTFIGTKRSFSDGITAFGKNAAELTMAPIDDGTNLPLVLS